MNETRADLLKEIIKTNRETAKEIWKIYHKEMLRLIENPSSQPDVSVLERFIQNESGTFAQELAKLFKDAIEFEVSHAEFVAELGGYAENAEAQ